MNMRIKVNVGEKNMQCLAVTDNSALEKEKL